MIPLYEVPRCLTHLVWADNIWIYSQNFVNFRTMIQELLPALQRIGLKISLDEASWIST